MVDALAAIVTQTENKLQRLDLASGAQNCTVFLLGMLFSVAAAHFVGWQMCRYLVRCVGPITYVDVDIL